MSIYYNSPDAARAAGELELYRESTAENRRTRKAIDDAITAHFDGMRLPDAALRDVLAACDPDRVALVLAATVRDKEHDGRISANNKAWAAGVRVPDGAPEEPYASWFICHSHPAILNGFIDQFRRDAGKYTRKAPEPAAVPPRANAGYKIIAAIRTTPTAEIVIGKNDAAPDSYVVWDCENGDDYKTGRYCGSYRAALRIMGDMLTRYADAGWTAVHM